MTNLEINQTIHEARGLEWHEDLGNGICKHCGGLFLKSDNPSYTSDWRVYGEFLEWLWNEKWEWFNEFAYDKAETFKVNTLLNPLRGSTAFAKWWKEVK